MQLSKWLYLLLCCAPLFALELSVLGGREGGKPFSTLHIKDSEPFLCEAEKDDFDRTSRVICAFSRRPSQDFKPLGNNFFSISSETRGDTYFIIVTPYAKMELVPLLFELNRETRLFGAAAERSRHWMIVGYTESLPLLRREPSGPTAINFPVTFSQEPMPYVGGLDIKGNPIKISRIQDVSDYVAIKRFYKTGSYDKALELTEAALAAYPDTIFRSELLLYQIRCYHQLEKPEELLEAAKRFIRTYSSDENIPEVLAYTANAYAKMGLYIDADYFFDRLFMEHAGSRFATLGKIYKAEQLVDSGNSKKALLFYDEALNQAKDVELAAKAAFEMAQHYIEHGDKDKAAEYAEKIITGNPGYFAEQFLASREMAQAFANRGRSDVAAGIAGALLAKMNKGHEFYEVLLKDLGIWLADSKQTENALRVLDDYLVAYQYGSYREEVKRAKDALFFDIPDRNVSQTLASYDELMAKYGSDPIGEKACYRKAELLFEAGRYSEVLEMNASLAQLDPLLYPRSQTLVGDAAAELMKEALRSKACATVISLSGRYRVALDEKWDESLFECAYVGGDFGTAKTIAGRYIKSKDAQSRMRWLYRYIETDFATGNYEEAAAASEELITLLPTAEEGAFRNIYRIRFDAYRQLGNADRMIASIGDVEKIFGLHFDDVERYTQMVTLAQEKRDSAMVEVYGERVMKLQRRSGSYTQSPYIEFTLTQALIDLQKNRKAYETVVSLDERSLTPQQRARAKYLEGSLLQKLGRPAEAKVAYEAAEKADGESAWGKLARDALALMS